MYPEPLFELFGYEINLYLIAYGLGFVPVLALAVWLGRERGIPALLVVDVWLVAVVADLIGTLLLVAVLQQFGVAVPANWSIAQIVAVAGAVGIYAVVASRYVPRFPGAADVAAPPIALYLVFARLGCFAAGCCHGLPDYGLAWAVTFNHPASASIYKGIPVHPTQLYEAAGGLVLLVLLLALRNRPAFRGLLIYILMLGYGVLRFVVEFYRGDVRVMVGDLSLSQVGCLVLIALGGVMLVRGLGRFGLPVADWRFER